MVSREIMKDIRESQIKTEVNVEWIKESLDTFALKEEVDNKFKNIKWIIGVFITVVLSIGCTLIGVL